MPTSGDRSFDTLNHRWLIPAINWAHLMLLLAMASPGDLQRARRMVDVDLRYAEAVVLLEEVLRDAQLVPGDRLEAAKLLGLAAAATGDASRAQQAFIQVLELEPEFELGEQHSPKIRTAFEKAQSIVANRPRITRVIALPQGRTVEITATVHDPQDMVQSMLLFVRFGGQDFNPRTMTREQDQARKVVTLPELADLRLEYFVSAQDADQQELAHAGTAQSPSMLVVDRQLVTQPAPPTPESPAWYKRWWVWAIVGGVAAAATATTLVVVSQGSNEPVGTLDPIRLD